MSNQKFIFGTNITIEQDANIMAKYNAMTERQERESLRLDEELYTPYYYSDRQEEHEQHSDSDNNL